MNSNLDYFLYLKHTLELALLASSRENIDQVYFYSLYLIHLSKSEKKITEQESIYLSIVIEIYYNKLKKFEKLACGIDRSLIV